MENMTRFFPQCGIAFPLLISKESGEVVERPSRREICFSPGRLGLRGAPPGPQSPLRLVRNQGLRCPGPHPVLTRQDAQGSVRPRRFKGSSRQTSGAYSLSGFCLLSNVYLGVRTSQP